jgi:signal transduction histidine kinase
MGTCLGLLLGISWIVFVSKGMAANALRHHFTNAQYFEYLPFPLVVWAAIRFQTWGAVVASLIVSLLAIAGTLNQTGPFVIQTPNLYQAILLLQVFIGIVTATALFLSAAVSERQRAERQLRATLERDRLLGEVALRIRQSLDLGDICQTAVEEVRQLLQADRVYIGHCDREEPLQIRAESVRSDYPSLLARQDTEQLLTDFRSLVTHPDTLVADNVAQLDISASLRLYYHRYRVKAALVVPLTAQQSLLGLLVVHQCSQTRQWQKSEVRLSEQLATSISIAIQQAQLYQQVQDLNSNLEQQVQERTAQLQEKIEEVQQLHAMKTVFLQAVAHDLRTSILGLLMLLKNLQTHPGENVTLSRTILDCIVHSGDRQLTLINALSENHFEQNYPITLQRQEIYLKQWITAVIDHWQPLFAQHQGKITLALPSDLPAIAGDPVRLREVFDHLLQNTLQHNPPGIHLTIAARRQQNMLHLSLTDDGVGLTALQCHQLFDLYVRSFHNPRLTGIGLGSYQCRQVIEAHGGNIGVKSEPTMGTQIWFTLPLAAAVNALDVAIT